MIPVIKRGVFLTQPVSGSHAVCEEVQGALAEQGLCAVVAGGAARDLVLGREPKDYDLVVIATRFGRAVEDDVDLLGREAVYRVRKGLLLPQDAVRLYATYRDKGAGSRIGYVVKFTYKGVDFDVIEYMESPRSAEGYANEFDCTLNQVWIDENGYVDWTDEFQACAIDQDEPVRPLRSLDGDVLARLDYLKSKYPELDYSYNYKDSE